MRLTIYKNKQFDMVHIIKQPKLLFYSKLKSQTVLILKLLELFSIVIENSSIC